MDNSFKTFLQHAMKITLDYLSGLFIFAIFSYPILNLSGDHPGRVVRWASFILFLIVFALIYKDMQEMAIREKRPQYEIYPTPLRGFLLGLTGLVPVWLMQLIVSLIPLKDLDTLQLRILQVISVPVYWISSLLGTSKLLYPTTLLLLAGMAFLGYWAGLKEFYLMKRFYKLIGYTPKVRIRKPRKKTGKGFWGM